LHCEHLPGQIEIDPVLVPWINDANAASNSFSCMTGFPDRSQNRHPLSGTTAAPGLHGGMHKSAAPSHEPAYLWILGVNGLLRWVVSGLDPKNPETLPTTRYTRNSKEAKWDKLFLSHDAFRSIVRNELWEKKHEHDAYQY
jgi:hypothetical protein